MNFIRVRTAAVSNVGRVTCYNDSNIDAFRCAALHVNTLLVLLRFAQFNAVQTASWKHRVPIPAGKENKETFSSPKKSESAVRPIQPLFNGYWLYSRG